MTDNVIFNGTSSSPPANTVVATDYVGTGGGGSAHFQRMKLDIGPDGTTIPMAWGGTGMPLGTLPGTVQALGTLQPLAGSVHLASPLPGTAQILGTVRALDGSVAVIGTQQALGTVQPLAGSVHPAAALPGTSHITGTVQPLAGSVHLASGLPGTTQVLGSVRSVGTTEALGTVQPLAGSVHVANVLSGTFQPHGTGQTLGTVRALVDGITVEQGTIPGGTVVAQPLPTGAGTYLAVRLSDGANFYNAEGGGGGGGASAVDESAFAAGVTAGAPMAAISTIQAIGQGSVGLVAMALDRVLYVRGAGGTFSGTVQTHGTSQALGTLQPLAGSVHPAAALPGTSHITGTVQPLAGSVHLASGLPGTVQALGTVQTHGTSQVLGSVRSVGTTEALGTVQPLAGSVHLASALPGGSVSVQGYAAHDAAAAGNPVLLGAFGSSGAPAAVGEQDAVRLWADLAGRLQVVGSVTAAPTGTQQALGTVQPLAGSVHLANTISGTVQAHGTAQVLGTVRALIDAGTAQVLGSVRSVGTTEALGTVQPLAGSVHPAAALPGTSQVSGTVRALAPSGTALGETFFGTIYTAAANDATLIGAPGAGTFIRIYDILVSGSAAGTVRLLDNAEGTAYGHLHLAANGGWSFSSSRGVRSRAANRAVLLDCTAGTWGIMINYALET